MIRSDLDMLVLALTRTYLSIKLRLVISSKTSTPMRSPVAYRSSSIALSRKPADVFVGNRLKAAPGLNQFLIIWLGPILRKWNLSGCKCLNRLKSIKVTGPYIFSGTADLLAKVGNDFRSVVRRIGWKQLCTSLFWCWRRS
jgi:hypothetical protein